MTPINLMNALKERTEQITKNYKFQQSNGGHALREIKVHLQHLPEKMYDNEIDPADYPFVLIMMGGGTVNEAREGNCSITFMIGGYDDGITIDGGVRDRQGWLIPAEIIWRIISDLELNSIIDGRYALQRPITWELPEEQPAPMWFGLISAVFSVPVIQEERGMDWWETNPTMDKYDDVHTLRREN